MRLLTERGLKISFSAVREVGWHLPAMASLTYWELYRGQRWNSQIPGDFTVWKKFSYTDVKINTNHSIMVKREGEREQEQTNQPCLDPELESESTSLKLTKNLFPYLPNY